MSITLDHTEVITIKATIVFDEGNEDLIPSVIRRIQQNQPADAAYKTVLRRAGQRVPRGFQVDHLNQNPYDNRLENLRIVPRSINMLNTKKHKSMKSKYHGVFPTALAHPKDWRYGVLSDHTAQATMVWLGTEDDEVEAARAYNEHIIINGLDWPLNRLPEDELMERLVAAGLI